MNRLPLALQVTALPTEPDPQTNLMPILYPNLSLGSLSRDLNSNGQSKRLEPNYLVEVGQVSNSVTRFGDIFPLWQNFEVFGKVLVDLNNVW